MTRVLALADQSKIGCITQRRFAKVGTKPHPQRGAALDRNGLSVSTETACRFEPKSPVGNSEICTMSSFATLIQDLVIANRILAKEDVVDAYGHVSVRHPDNPKRFFISRSLAPELIEKGDIVELDLDGAPVDADEKRSLYLERFIHAAIFQLRP